MTEIDQSSSRDNGLPPNLQRKKETIIAKYGDLMNFCRTFNPQRQVEFCANKERCFFGTAPTLADLNMAYAKTAARFWLQYQILDLCRYANVKTMSDMQVEELAAIISLKYYWLKTTELMYFFFQMKSAEYGKFYGSIDPMEVMAALKKFITFRGETYEKKYQQELSDREASWKKTAISYHEYQKLLTQEKENGNTDK